MDIDVVLSCRRERRHPAHAGKRCTGNAATNPATSRRTGPWTEVRETAKDQVHRRGRLRHFSGRGPRGAADRRRMAEAEPSTSAGAGEEEGWGRGAWLRPEVYKDVRRAARLPLVHEVDRRARTGKGAPRPRLSPWSIPGNALKRRGISGHVTPELSCDIFCVILRKKQHLSRR